MTEEDVSLEVPPEYFFRSRRSLQLLQPITGFSSKNTFLKARKNS